MASWWDVVLGVLLAPARSGVVATPTHADQEAAAPLVAADPTFRLSRFVRHAGLLIDRMNRAIDDQDLEAVRAVASPAFAERVVARLERDRTSYVRRQRWYQGAVTISVVAATPAAAGSLEGDNIDDSDDIQDTVVLDLAFRAGEGEMSLLDGRGGDGSPNVRPRRERWTLTRGRGAAETSGAGDWKVADIAAVGEASPSEAWGSRWIWRPDPD